jgi:RNA polymerase sigma-70 factor (ECF subfamily)
VTGLESSAVGSPGDMRHDPPSEGDLIAAAQKGDREAFERLYRDHVGHVYALCLRMVANVDEAETLTQDVFVRAWQKLDLFEGRGAFGGWLRRVTTNMVIESKRRQSREREILDHNVDMQELDMGRLGVTQASDATAAVGAGVTHPRQTEVAIDLERAIAALPPGARQVFVLHDVAGYRYREIAEIMGVATGTVKAHLHRARMLLRKALLRSGEGIVS